LRLLVVLLSESRWNIHKNDPVTHAIQSLPGWFFINPLVYLEFHEPFRAEHTISKPYISAILDNQAIISTDRLMFLIQDEILPENIISEAGSEISRLLANLRYISKQFYLRTEVRAVSIVSQEKEISQLPRLRFPMISRHHSKVFMRQYLVDTAITWKHLEIASTIPSNFTSPIFDIILLDAINARADGDYRKTILYSAMSVEIIAATKLDEAYDAIIQQGDDRADLRMISIPQAGGQTSVKDPVYDYLSNKSDFAQLLHERPLYLLKRSLCVDNQQLYQTALKLYRSRNKIVHRGEPPGGEQMSYFGINQPDALTAIECAIEIFKWFGEPDKYVAPRVEFYYEARGPREVIPERDSTA